MRDAGGCRGQYPRRGRRAYADAGLGLTVRGTIFDQPLTARVDVPVWIRKVAGSGKRLWWVISLSDLW